MGLREGPQRDKTARPYVRARHDAEPFLSVLFVLFFFERAAAFQRDQERTGVILWCVVLAQ